MEIPAYLFIYVAMSAILSLLQQTIADSPPIFRKEPSSEYVKQNSWVKLKCKTDPKDANIAWIFNGNDVIDSEAKLGMLVHRGSLIIQEFTDELNQGTYQCIASNNAGAVISREAYLQVAYIKTFPKTLPDRTYSQLGQLAAINCQRPESLPPAEMEYFFNGEPVVENDHYRIMPSGSLHILHTSAVDQGVYGCSAVNPVTKRNRDLINATILEIINVDESSTARDEVAVIVIASGASVHAGEQALLECVPYGIPFPNVRWRRQGGELPELAVHHVGSLKIPNVSTLDAGTYECIVESRAGAPVTREVTLYVIELPAITKPPKSISVGVGGAAQFKCGVTGASEQNITWLHNAQPIPQDNPKYMVQVGTGGVQLLVTDITRTQLGVYQCVVRTNQGMDHAVAILKFRDGFPRITRTPLNTTAIEGETVVMSCGVTGDPLPVVSWTGPNHQSIINGRRTIIYKEGLTISDVGPMDAGWYRCTATNRHGAIHSDVNLAIIEKLVVTLTELPPSRQAVGKPLSSDDGNMTVKITEESEKPGTVPDAPGKPEIFKTSETSVEVRWVQTDSGTAPITGYTVDYRNIRVDPDWLIASSAVDPSNRSYEVRNLSPGGTYRFRVTAVNQYGNSAPSEMSNRFFLQASMPTVRPVRVSQGEVRITSSKAISSSAIEVIWEYTPDVFNTDIDGFYLFHRDTDSDDDLDYIRTPVVGEDTDRYLIDKLEPEVSYDIKMASFNKGGTGSYSNVVIVATSAPETPITFIPGQAILSPDTEPNNGLGMPNLPEESPHPNNNSSSTHSQDILYITLGVVLGAMLLVLIMFGVMCIWRAKQVNTDRMARMECDWRQSGPYYDSSYRYVNTNDLAPRYKYHVNSNASMNGGPSRPPNHMFEVIGHLPFGETATAIDLQPMYPLSQNGMDEHTLLSSQSVISNGHGPYPVTQPVKTVPMLPRSSESARSGFAPSGSREGPLHSGSSSEHIQLGNGSIRSCNSSSGPDAGVTSSGESGRTRRPKCPHRHHKTDVNKAVRRQPREHPTSTEGSVSSIASVKISPPQTPTSATQPTPSLTSQLPPLSLATQPPPRSDGTDSLQSRSRSSSNLSNASSCRKVNPSGQADNESHSKLQRQKDWFIIPVTPTAPVLTSLPAPLPMTLPAQGSALLDLS